MKDLNQQSEKLSAGLLNFTELSNEAVSILDALNANLAGTNKLTARLHDRATALRCAEENITDTKNAVDELLAAMDTTSKVESELRRGPQADLAAFLAHLAQLDESMAFLELHSSLRSAQEAYAHAEGVHLKALHDCEVDFKNTLSYHSTALLPSSSFLTQLAQEQLQEAASKSQLEQLPPEAVERLKRLAEVMLQARHMNCIDVYTQLRVRAVESAMQMVGLEARSVGALQIQSPEQLEKTMKSWSLQLRVLLVLAAHEMELARAIWSSAMSDTVFGDVIPGVLELLLQMGRSIVGTRAQMQKVFLLLEMNRHLQEVIPLLESLLGKRARGSGRYAQCINDMCGLRAMLGSSARSIFLDLEGSVGRDVSKVKVLDGTVHPLCAQTLSYLRRLFSYSDVEQLIFSPSNKDGFTRTSVVTAAAIAAAGLDKAIDSSHLTKIQSKRGQEAASALMSEAVAQVMSALVTNLEEKARAYKSPALASLFLMNNVHYMVWAVEQSDRLSFLGQQWVEKHKDIVERYGSQYHELTWMPMVNALDKVNRKEDPEPADQKLWCEWVKSKYHHFNSSLEAIYAEQTGWTIPEPKLLAAVRRVILMDVIPPYEKFSRHFSVLDFSTNRSKYVRYAPKDIRSMVEQHLFEGRKMSLSKVARAPPTNKQGSRISA